LLHLFSQSAHLNTSTKQAVDRSEGSFQAGNGQKIFYRRWSAVEPRAVILLAHGLAEHSGRYYEFADFFAEEGFTTWALDHPGHGQSGGKRGHVGQFEEYTDALGQLLTLARQAHPDIPFVLLRHSMGGLIAADFLLQHQDEFVAAVLTARPFSRGNNHRGSYSS
jgi:alpha-beta hydrolase superfamily lysophospholipase